MALLLVLVLLRLQPLVWRSPHRCGSYVMLLLAAADLLLLHLPVALVPTKMGVFAVSLDMDMAFKEQCHDPSGCSNRSSGTRSSPPLPNLGNVGIDPGPITSSSAVGLANRDDDRDSLGDGDGDNVRFLVKEGKNQTTDRVRILEHRLDHHHHHLVRQLQDMIITVKWTGHNASLVSSSATVIQRSRISIDRTTVAVIADGSLSPVVYFIENDSVGTKSRIVKAMYCRYCTATEYTFSDVGDLYWSGTERFYSLLLDSGYILLADNTYDAVRKVGLYSGSDREEYSNLERPLGLAKHPEEGTLYVSGEDRIYAIPLDYTSSLSVRKVLAGPSSTISTYTGMMDSQLSSEVRFDGARINPRSITPDGSVLYLADSGNNRIRMVNTATGATETVLTGNVYSNLGLLDADPVATRAPFSSPLSPVLTTNGCNMFVGEDRGNGRIRWITFSSPGGRVLQVKTIIEFTEPTGITITSLTLSDDDGYLFAGLSIPGIVRFKIYTSDLHDCGPSSPTPTPAPVARPTQPPQSTPQSPVAEPSRSAPPVEKSDTLQNGAGGHIESTPISSVENTGSDIIETDVVTASSSGGGPSPGGDNGKGASRVIVAVGVSIAAFVVVLLAGIALFVFLKKRVAKTAQGNEPPLAQPATAPNNKAALEECVGLSVQPNCPRDLPQRGQLEPCVMPLTPSSSVHCTSGVESGVGRREVSVGSEMTVGSQIDESDPMLGSVPGLTRFTLSELQIATANFGPNHLLAGKGGGFGDVYRATVMVGQSPADVAIKVMKQSFDRANNTLRRRQFAAELKTLNELRHKHLCKLVGFCLENDMCVLVYPFITGGSLYDRLHGDAASAAAAAGGAQAGAATPGQDIGPNLDLAERLSIAKQMATVLRYMHHEVDPPVLHRDIKTRNVMVKGEGKNLCVILIDFGLAKLVEAPQDQPQRGAQDPQDTTGGGRGGPQQTVITFTVSGTPGYMAPEYITQIKLTSKNDVYAFGVVLLELLTGHKAVWMSPYSPGEQECLTSWSRRFPFHEGAAATYSQLEPFFDSRLKSTFKTPEDWQVAYYLALLAMMCTNDCPDDRPTAQQALAHIDQFCKQIPV